MKLSWRFSVLVLLVFGTADGKAEDAGCQQAAVAITKNSTWLYNASQNILQWYRPSQVPPAIPACGCNSGEQSIVKITLTDSKTKGIISNSVCYGCKGGAKVADDVLFSADQPPTISSKFGPCANITVYRCCCPTTTATITPKARSSSTAFYVP